LKPWTILEYIFFKSKKIPFQWFLGKRTHNIDWVSLYWNNTMWPLLLVGHLYWSHYRARLVVVNGHQNDMCDDGVEICAQIIITIISSIMNNIGRVYVVPWKKDPLIPNLSSHNLASWETSNLKLEMIVYPVCNY
jgi:hypothetical protein